MKNLSQKIIKYVMKSKKRKVYCVLGLVYFLAVVFVMNDAWLYQTPIAKLTKVETRMTGEGKSTRGTKEKKYEQNIQGVVLNGKNKGKKVSFSHEYTYTGMPLRYNNDKQKKPLFSRGLSVCRLLFNSFSKLKIDENYKEKRRLFY